MLARRMLFVRPRPLASLAPLYLALLLIVALSLFGFAVALWPEDPAPAAIQMGDRQSAPASRVFEGGLELPPAPQAPRSRSNWM